VKTKSEIENIAVIALKMEAEAISNLTQNINEDFINTVHNILQLKGRVIITGIGKSAIIAQKIVATMNSTGTPAIFMHAADAIHGDLGMLQQEDIVMAISKSGNTPEIKVLIPLLKNCNAKIIAMVGNTKSYLAEHADFVLDTTVACEAGSLNLAPTCSTTAQLAMGDALAICLLECRSFSSEDFARYHPGGMLGKQLYLKVQDLSIHHAKPMVQMDTPIKTVLVEITRHRLGAVAVLDGQHISGIITDGDIRRMLESNKNIEALQARDIMGRNPKLIPHDMLAVHALNMMRNHSITQLLVTKQDEYEGIIHLHDLLKEGII